MEPAGGHLRFPLRVCRPCPYTHVHAHSRTHRHPAVNKKSPSRCGCAFRWNRTFRRQQSINSGPREGASVSREARQVSEVNQHRDDRRARSSLHRADQGRLLDCVVRWGNLTEGKIRAYLGEVLEAVRYLHNCRIAHLDLKVSGAPGTAVCATTAQPQHVCVCRGGGPPSACPLNPGHMPQEGLRTNMRR